MPDFENDNTTQKTDDKPEKTTPAKAPKRRAAHDALDIEGWLKTAPLSDLADRLAHELTIRGIETVDDLSRPNVMDTIVKSIMSAIKIDANTLMSFRKEK